MVVLAVSQFGVSAAALMEHSSLRNCENIRERCAARGPHDEQIRIPRQKLAHRCVADRVRCGARLARDRPPMQAMLGPVDRLFYSFMDMIDIPPGYPASLDLHHLQVFDVLLRERSLTRAARVLNVTQPALSKTLARLRRYFQDPLFVRVSLRMEPTAKALVLEA